MEGRRIPVQPKGDRPRGASALVLRLLRKLAAPLTRPLTDSKRGGKRSRLPEAGNRSGEGAASVTPYLEEGRRSRPGPLE
jgi:hypothetical protein